MNDLTIENAHIIYKQFSGNDKFNPGVRSFSVVLDEADAEVLEADGWNIRHKPSKNDPEVMVHTLQVRVRYDKRPPRVVMIGDTSKRVTFLTEDTIGQLDTAAIKNIDLTINPSPWSTMGKSGIKAYLKTAYVTIEEDNLDLKYAALLASYAKSISEGIDAQEEHEDDSNVPF